MSKTYQAIASQTLSANAGSIIFTAIPQTYTDLVLVAHTRTFSDGNTQIRFNGDVAGNYSRVAMGGSGTTTISQKLNSQSSIPLDLYESAINSNFVTSALGGPIIAHIMSYTSAAQKMVLSISGSAQRGVNRSCGVWTSTAPITQIEFTGPGNLASNTVVSLYGIKAE